jgi:hypothetical protein
VRADSLEPAEVPGPEVPHISHQLLAFEGTHPAAAIPLRSGPHGPHPPEDMLFPAFVVAAEKLVPDGLTPIFVSRDLPDLVSARSTVFGVGGRRQADRNSNSYPALAKASPYRS